LPGRFGQHLGFGVDADRFCDVSCQPQYQLAGSAAQVEQSSGAVEAEAGDEVGEEGVRIAGPISRLVPGSSCEKGAAGAVGRIGHEYLLLFRRVAILSCSAIDLGRSHRL
jgi:hypothetical protein